MMKKFKLISSYQPKGDQPQAIDELAQAVLEGEQYQTLLGVTGSGKTFTIANVIEKVNKPTLVLSHNKTLAAFMKCRIAKSIMHIVKAEKFTVMMNFYGAVTVQVLPQNTFLFPSSKMMR